MTGVHKGVGRWRDLWQRLQGGWRFGLTVLALFGLALAVSGRIVWLHTVRHDFLAEQGDKRSLRHVEIGAHRGIITDRNGELFFFKQKTAYEIFPSMKASWCTITTTALPPMSWTEKRH